LVFDHTSILKLIEWRWGLSPLTARDASCDIENLALVLDFENCDAELPDLPHPAVPPPMPCLEPGLPSSLSSSANPWLRLRESGWPLRQR